MTPTNTSFSQEVLTDGAAECPEQEIEACKIDGKPDAITEKPCSGKPLDGFRSSISARPGHKQLIDRDLCQVLPKLHQSHIPVLS